MGTFNNRVCSKILFHYIQHKWSQCVENYSSSNFGDHLIVKKPSGNESFFYCTKYKKSIFISTTGQIFVKTTISVCSHDTNVTGRRDNPVFGIMPQYKSIVKINNVLR